jgi:hypothetical protein
MEWIEPNQFARLVLNGLVFLIIISDWNVLSILDILNQAIMHIMEMASEIVNGGNWGRREFCEEVRVEATIGKE